MRTKRGAPSEDWTVAFEAEHYESARTMYRKLARDREYGSVALVFGETIVAHTIAPLLPPEKW